MSGWVAGGSGQVFYSKIGGSTMEHKMMDTYRQICGLCGTSGVGLSEDRVLLNLLVNASFFSLLKLP